MIKISVLILNFNGYKSTIECYRSLEGQVLESGTKISITIVDNGSKDESVKEIRKALPQASLLLTGKNLGFTGGNNFGMKQAIEDGADYIVILNNDTRVDKKLINNLFASIKDDEQAAGVLPKIYFERGFEFHKRYKDSDKGKVIWYAGGIMDWANLIGKNLGVDEVDSGQYDNREETELATGCCFMIKASVLKKVGFFDDRYFLYYEDADLTERIKRAGYKIYFEPSAFMWHKNAESSGGSGSALQDYFITRNRLLFGMKYAPLRTRVALLKESARLYFSGRQWQRKGVVDFYLGRFGKGSYKI